MKVGVLSIDRCSIDLFYTASFLKTIFLKNKLDVFIIRSGGMLGGKIDWLFPLGSRGGIFSRDATIFPLSVFFPFGTTLPVVGLSYRSLLLLEDAINSKPIDSKLVTGAFVYPL